MFLPEEFRLKVGLAEMMKGGVIMDVTNAEQAKIAEKAGASAVMALERVPSDIRKEGGVARMAAIRIIREIMDTVSIPVMAKARIGHFAEAQILESLGVDYIDESEVLTPADYSNHIDKWNFKVPFVCGATNLGEALRRINEGAAMIRSKGEAGTGDGDDRAADDTADVRRDRVDGGRCGVVEVVGGGVGVGAAGRAHDDVHRAAGRRAGDRRRGASMRGPRVAARPVLRRDGGATRRRRRREQNVPQEESPPHQHDRDQNPNQHLSHLTEQPEQQSSD
mgnify:CR=1 FL=1